MPSLQRLRRAIHGLIVERLVDVPGVAAFERVGDPRVVDDVSIELGFRVERAVKGLRLFLGGGDA